MFGTLEKNALRSTTPQSIVIRVPLVFKGSNCMSDFILNTTSSFMAVE